MFGALRAAEPSTGAKPIVRAHASAAGDIAIDDEGAFTDIDTEEEYRKTISARLSGGELTISEPEEGGTVVSCVLPSNAVAVQ